MFKDQLAHMAVWKVMAAFGAVAILALGGMSVYAGHEHQVSAQLAGQTEEMSSELAATRNQVEQLTAKVNELNTQVSNSAAQTAAAQAAAAQEMSAASKQVVHRKHVDDSRLRKLQAQIDAQGDAINTQGKAIDDTRDQLAGTRDDLSNTRTELTGSIARTHDELVLLQKKGERNYYEFDVEKSRQFKVEGPVGVRLRKANTKHDYADLELMLNDKSVTQKHVNIYQSVMFYTPDIPQPIELVINNISKDHIHGYISAPKYRQSELAAMQSTNNTGSPNGSTGPNAAREKLPSPH
jgi:hypothetical protein